MASVLKVHCKVCGEGFRIPNQMDETTFRAASHQLVGKAYQCSKCGQTRYYDGPDHFFG